MERSWLLSHSHASEPGVQSPKWQEGPMPGEHRTRKVASSPASCQNFSCNFLSRSCCVLGEYVQVHVSVHSAGRCHTHTACMRIQIGLCSPGLCVNECVICMSCVWLFLFSCHRFSYRQEMGFLGEGRYFTQITDYESLRVPL